MRLTVACASIMVALAACGPNDLRPIHAPPGLHTARDGSARGGPSPAEAGARIPNEDGSSPRAWKRGVAYGYHSDADLAALSAGIAWWYNWSPKPAGTLRLGYAQL